MPTNIYGIYRPKSILESEERPADPVLLQDPEDTDASENEAEDPEGARWRKNIDTVKCGAAETRYESWVKKRLQQRFKGQCSFPGAVSEVGYVEWLLHQAYEQNPGQKFRVFHR